jgi:hypothetical protein
MCINDKNLTPWKREANKTQDATERSLHNTKKNMFPTHTEQKEEIRKRVTTIYKQRQFRQAILRHLMMAK